MKKLFYLTIFILFSCNSAQNDTPIHTETAANHITRSGQNTTVEKHQKAWKGQLGSEINVLLHYQKYENLVVGQIIYLDTKEHKPIPIIGTVEEGENYRILEFDHKGNITGIISGVPSAEIFKANWFSPKTGKEYSMNMSKLDSIIPEKNIEANLDKLAGEYAYQYGTAGYQGHVKVQHLEPDQITIQGYSVTSEPARNIAEMEIKASPTQKDILHTVPEAENCQFRIRFFKDFVYISNTKTQCTGAFGHNATLEGIYYKTQ
ncbi:MAG: hypothetical protein Q4F57_10145 [Weeksellaceae bacterium]|nr:hypothetical protein [Weeksellaceae bacterium]